MSEIEVKYKSDKLLVVVANTKYKYLFKRDPQTYTIFYPDQRRPGIRPHYIHTKAYWYFNGQLWFDDSQKHRGVDKSFFHEQDACHLWSPSGQYEHEQKIWDRIIGDWIVECEILIGE